MPEVPKTKLAFLRRRFSLRFLIALLTVVALLLAWAGRQYNRCQQEAELVERLAEDRFCKIKQQPKSTGIVDTQLSGILSLPAYSVEIDSLRSMNLMPEIAKLKHVHHLSTPTESTDLIEFACHSNLRSLEVDGWDLKSISRVRGMTSLERLVIHDSNNLESIDELRGNRCIKQISLRLERGRRDFELGDPSDVLASLPNLRTFLASHCVLNDLEDLRQLKGLEGLEVSVLPTESNFEPLSELKSLRYLSLFETKMLKDLDCLSSMKDLERIRLRDCDSLENVEAIRNLSKLQDLHLYHCEQLTDLMPIADCKLLKLVTIDVQDIDQVKDQIAALKKALPTTRIVVNKIRRPGQPRFR